MRKLRIWLATLGLAFAVGMAFAAGMAAFGMQPAAQVTIDPGWRYTNGYWNYWQPDDQAWYYTDGRTWYTYGDNAWKVYNFDRKFGRDAFYREGYTIPKPGPEVVVPRHRVYVPR